MGKIKERKFELEEQLFDIIHGLHHFLNMKDKTKYKLGLRALDVINDDYKKLTGEYYIDQLQILEYHSKQWEF